MIGAVKLIVEILTVNIQVAEVALAVKKATKAKSIRSRAARAISITITLTKHTRAC